jgi:hypothetical protein
MIKLVITDLDQTLLSDDGTITEDNKKAIKSLREKGVQFGVASGRAEHIIEKLMGEAGLLDSIDVIIGFNGVTVNDSTVLSSQTVNFLKKDIILSVYQTFKGRGFTFVVHDQSNIYCDQNLTFSDLESSLNGYGIKVDADFESLITADYPKLMLVGTPEDIDAIQVELESLKDTRYSFFKSHENFMEVVAPGVSKGGILTTYCTAKGIDMNQVMAIGDNLNDLHMVKAAGYGIAVANAVPEVKAAATWISTSNNDSGVAEAIRKFVG